MLNYVCAPSKTDQGCGSMWGDLLQKMIKKMCRKTAIDVKYTPQNKGEQLEGDNGQLERERMIYVG